MEKLRLLQILQLPSSSINYCRSPTPAEVTGSCCNCFSSVPHPDLEALLLHTQQSLLQLPCPCGESQLPESRLPKSQLPRSQLTGSQLTGSQLPHSQLPYSQLLESQLPESQLPVLSQLPESLLAKAQLLGSQLPGRPSPSLISPRPTKQ